MDYKVNSPNVIYTEDTIVSKYNYLTTTVKDNIITPKEEKLIFKTDLKKPKLGVMLIGIGGNNGSTVVASILANKLKLSYETKNNIIHSNYYGSLTQSSTIKLGINEVGDNINIPFNKLLPLIDPNELVISGWDINSLNLYDSMRRSKVLDINLQLQLYKYMIEMTPLPSIYNANFIASNQADRVNNVVSGTKAQQISVIRQNIRDFKNNNNLDKVIILWTANTERMCEVTVGLNDSWDNLNAAINNDVEEISPSTLFAVSSILENCSYINGSPQNTFVPGVIELAMIHNVFISGDDFKSGQTKMKSVLVDYLVSAGIKPVSIVSYNHLGNNDGKNLSAPLQFNSKELSKSNVIDDMVESNSILYPNKNEKPDHCVVIKYVPYVNDSKRAMDEYTSEIFMGGINTIVMHNTCEDSLLAAPLIIDLILLCEMCERIKIKRDNESDDKYEKFHSVLSILSYLLKAPMVPPGTPVVNALAAQRQCIVNIFRACIGLAPENFMLLEHKIPSLMKQYHN